MREIESARRAMKSYRTVIHGHLVEMRVGDLGGEEVLVDGRPTSRDIWAGLRAGSHHFDLNGAAGAEDKTVHVEIRREWTRWGFPRNRALVLVDGVERRRLDPMHRDHPMDECPKCGYSLTGINAGADGATCPECGTPVAVLPQSADG